MDEADLLPVVLWDIVEEYESIERRVSVWQTPGGFTFWGVYVYPGTKDLDWWLYYDIVNYFRRGGTNPFLLHRRSRDKFILWLITEFGR